jgi:hypothetical protein
MAFAGLRSVPIHKLGSLRDRAALSGLSPNLHNRQNPYIVAVSLFHLFARLLI